MSTNNDKTKAFLLYLAAVEAKRDVLAAEIRALADSLPEGCDDARTNIEDAAKNVERVTLDGVRYVVTEAARPKGPMVFVHYPGTGRSIGRELTRVTINAIVLHGGDRFSRNTGRHIGWTSRDAAPYIEPEEMARIVATGWKAPPNGKQKLA